MHFTRTLITVLAVALLPPATSAQNRLADRDTELELLALKREFTPANSEQAIQRALAIAEHSFRQGNTRLTSVAIGTAMDVDIDRTVPACADLMKRLPAIRIHFAKHLDKILSLEPCPEQMIFLNALIDGIKQGDLGTPGQLTVMQALQMALQAGRLEKDVIRNAMIELICINPALPVSYPAEFYADQLAQPADIPRYRRIADDALAAGRLHPVLWFLAELGDQPTGEKLRAYRDANDATLRGSRGFIDHVIWRIEVQSSPQTLLEALRSGPPGLQRPWMIQRAVALGIPPAEIEPALREFIASAADLDDRAWEYLHPRTIAKAKELGIFPPSEPEPEPTIPEVSFTP